jgi:hypothetical protein
MFSRQDAKNAKVEMMGSIQIQESVGGNREELRQFFRCGHADWATPPFHIGNMLSWDPSQFFTESLLGKSMKFSINPHGANLDPCPLSLLCTRWFQKH